MNATVTLPRILAPPTDQQLTVLKFIFAHTRDNVIPPTIREIRDHMGFRGTNGVNDHLVALERRGLIVRQGLKSRAIRVTPEGMKVLRAVPDCELAPEEAVAELASLRAENTRLRATIASIRGVLDKSEESKG